MAMMTSGISVATTQDLNEALRSIDNKVAEQQTWVQNNIADFVQKLRLNTERIDQAERDQQTGLETLNADMKSLRQSAVSNMNFRQVVNQFEKRFDHERDENEGKLENLKIAMEKEIASSVGNLRLKAETLNANCIALTEKCKVLEETLIPAMKADLEEQKQKRLCETQRLESEIEKMKELCEQKISHTAAALRFYVTATATKLREECAPLTMAKELEEDLKQKETELKKKITTSEETVSALRDELVKQKDLLEQECDKYTREIAGQTKAVKVQEITVVNLQNNLASDLNDMREQIRSDRLSMQTEMSDNASKAARSAAQRDSAIETLTSQIQPLTQFQHTIVDRLHIEKIVMQVKDWQSGLMPQLTAATKDLEVRVNKVLTTSQKDHDLLTELKTGHSAIRGHFKMFHAIATGLDESKMPGEDALQGTASTGHEDTRLPPISGRSGVGV
jgi:hypothetical protein